MIHLYRDILGLRQRKHVRFLPWRLVIVQQLSCVLTWEHSCLLIGGVVNLASLGEHYTPWLKVSKETGILTGILQRSLSTSVFPSFQSPFYLNRKRFLHVSFLLLASICLAQSKNTFREVFSPSFGEFWTSCSQYVHCMNYIFPFYISHSPLNILGLIWTPESSIDVFKKIFLSAYYYRAPQCPT